MKTIYLHGYLHDLYPEPIRVEAGNVAEAIKSLSLIPELEPEEGKLHPIQVTGVDDEIALYSANGIDEIHVHPRRSGAGGKGGFMQIVLGVALIGLALAFPAGIAVFGSTISSGSIFMAGAMMALGGVLQLLAPTPGQPGGDDQEDSKYLPSSGNTVKIGTPIPILYGTTRAAGHYLTFDVDSKGVVGDASAGTDLTISGQGEAWDARAGLGDFAAGKFSYNFYSLRSTGAVFDEGVQEPLTFPPQDPWRVFAKGYVDELDPDALYDKMEALTPGYVAIYRGRYTADATGDHEFSGAEEFQIHDEAENEILPTGGAYPLVSGQSYEVSMWFSRGFDPSNSSNAPQILVKKPGQSFQQFIFEAIGVSGPTSVELQDSRYVEYDKTALQDGFAVLRPIYASATPSPSNIPISDWSA